MEPSRFRRFDPVFGLILILAAFLLFYHLGHRPFWQDEAETAGLARNVLKYGLPRAFDGINLISQEEGREFGADYIWRWSPWLQIYVAAAAFRLGGLTTEAGRFPFVLAGFACIWLVYRLIRHQFQDLAWACLSAAFLTLSVPFLLSVRQCRYYSLGALLVVINLYSFRSNWQSRLGPAILLTLSLGLLFHTNYLLFFSYAAPFGLAALFLYRRDLPLARVVCIVGGTALLVFPGLVLYGLKQQTGMIKFDMIPKNLSIYLADLFQFMVPLPIVLGLLWQWRSVMPGVSKRLLSSPERFACFLAIIVCGNIGILALVPQHPHRYLIHLYPLTAIILAWVVLKVINYQKFAGIILALLLGLTNWLNILPMDWLGITYRPKLNDFNTLTHPTLPLKLYLTELAHPYPDVNDGLIKFFQSQAHPGETILATYGDLPLQFYTANQVMGGLEGRLPAADKPPDWVVRRRYTRYNRNALPKSEDYVRTQLRLDQDYHPTVLTCPDERFGNIPDPDYHRFIPPTEPVGKVVVYRKNSSEGRGPGK
jgi:hypothetical protein